MPTRRDLIWKAALDLINRGGSFTVTDVVEAIGDNAPSRRTVQQCLSSMESFGIIDGEGGEGRAPRVFSTPTPLTDGGIEASNPKPSDVYTSTFPYPGGKGRKSDWIIEKMVPHDTYVEPFAGSAALLYNKPKSKIEVINDVNDDITQFFDVLRNRENELVEWLEAVPYSRTLYEQWVEEFHEGHRPSDAVERAGRFFALRYMQFAGEISNPTGFKVRAKRSPARSFANARRRLHELASRFSEVIVENRDYKQILETYDDPSVDVLFYCDPPYMEREQYYPYEFDHDEFVNYLTDVDGYWMVSYTTLPDGLDDYYILERERRHRMARGSERATERLVCNFDPEKMPQFINQEFSQTRLG